MTGQNAFISMNSVRMQAGHPVESIAPAVFAGAVLTPPNLTIADVSAQLLTIAFSPTDIWATAVLGGLNVFQGRPQNASVNFYKGPYQYAGTIDGNPVPLVSPLTVPAIIPFALGQRVHVAFRAFDADTRISTLQRDSIISVA
jgi:hypothetical protein